MTFKRKRKDVPLNFNRKINDGKWHKIQLNKKKRKLIMTLDTNLKKPVRVPKTAVKNELYLAGVPSESEMMKSDLLVSIFLNYF